MLLLLSGESAITSEAAAMTIHVAGWLMKSMGSVCYTSILASGAGFQFRHALLN